MSDSVLLAVVLGVWLLTGLVLAVVLGRRGHDPFGWLVLGTLMGPVAIFLALDSVEHDEQDRVEVVAVPAGHSGGDIDVLVGVDGSAGSKAAVGVAERLFGDRMDRLTFVNVVPHDSGHIDDRKARSKLLEATRAAPPEGIGLEVAHGRPATAMQQLALRDHYDVIVIGTSAEDRVHALGDAAVDLARDSAVPVLLVPPNQAGENDDHE